MVFLESNINKISILPVEILTVIALDKDDTNFVLFFRSKNTIGRFMKTYLFKPRYYNFMEAGELRNV